MGLFGKSEKPTGAQPGHGFDWGAAAMGLLGVPASVLQKRREDKAEQAQLQQLYSAIDNDPNLSTPEAKAYARMFPKEYAAAYMSRFNTFQFGSGGGSTGRMGPDGQMHYQTAPRFDDNGNIFGPGNGTGIPPILQRGTKAIPLQPGGHVGIVDSISGRPVMTDGSVPGVQAPRSGGPQPGTIEDGYMFKGGDPADPKSWVPVQGGAGPAAAPRTFPGR